MQKNVGTIDAIMRITCGLTGIAWATSRMVRHPRRGMPVAVAMMGAMRVAEGVTRFCPMLKFLGANTLEKSGKRLPALQGKDQALAKDTAHQNERE